MCYELLSKNKNKVTVAFMQSENYFVLFCNFCSSIIQTSHSQEHSECLLMNISGLINYKWFNRLMPTLHTASYAVSPGESSGYTLIDLPLDYRFSYGYISYARSTMDWLILSLKQDPLTLWPPIKCGEGILNKETQLDGELTRCVIWHSQWH